MLASLLLADFEMTFSRPVIASLTALLLAMPALAQQTGPLQCVKEQKLQRTTCNADAKTACDTAFQSAIPPCFGDAAPCAQSCLDAQAACQAPVRDRLTRCESACSTHESDGRHACEAHNQGTSCTRRVRVRSLKCRARCTLDADPQTQACATHENDCLKQCAAR